ncbi:MAG: glycosyltransferase [Thiobacillaceae bacterium]
MPRILWWGRFDPDYSRNRVVRGLLVELGWSLVDFHPRFSSLGDVEAHLRHLPKPDIVWVPCFRQRDLATAARWAKRQGVPLVFDPLISAYNKQVFERKKFLPDSWRARRLQRWERALFGRADIVIADTQAHADYFSEEFGIAPERIKVVYVGAETSLFQPAPMPAHADGRPLEVLFYGSFIELQAPQIIVEAARRYTGAPVRWTLLGKGPLRGECERLARGIDAIRFEDAVPYKQLPARIHRADILLGIFDAGAKAGRVIPNKVFQSLACGRPVVTRHSAAYPTACRDRGERGLVWVDPGNPDALAQAVGRLAKQLRDEPDIGQRAADLYQEVFSAAVIAKQLRGALAAAQDLWSH